MAVEQPAANEKLSTPDHSIMHRVLGVDLSATAQAIAVQSDNAIDLALSKVRITPLGGIAIKLTNNTGSQITKGYLVTASSNGDDEIRLTAVDGPDIIGAVYENIADGTAGWVVIAGIAEVYFQGNTTRGMFCRMTVAGDTGDGPGIAIAEAIPSSPFATDKHFQEIGHCIQTRTGAGLARAVLHFN